MNKVSLLKKYLPNTTSLKHYAGTNIITNVMVILNFGFWMGLFISVIAQITVELNQCKIFIERERDKGFRVLPMQYIKLKGIDCIWDTIFALLGIFSTLICVTNWL